MPIVYAMLLYTPDSLTVSILDVCLFAIDNTSMYTISDNVTQCNPIPSIDHDSAGHLVMPDLTKTWFYLTSSKTGLPWFGKLLKAGSLL